MRMELTPEAVQWFQTELGVRSGDAVRLFVKYGGTSPHHPGFSIGISTENPVDVAAQYVQDGITFFIRNGDLWFFEGDDVRIRYDGEADDLRFDLVPSGTID